MKHMTATDQASNVIREALIRELDEYDASSADLARLLGVTASAVNKWTAPAGNGISYPMALAVGFILGKSPDELSDTGRFAQPERTKGCDFVELAKHILTLCEENPLAVKSHALRIDAKHRAESYLLKSGHLKPGPIMRTFEPKETEPQVTNYTPGPRQAVPEIPEVLNKPSLPHVPDPAHADRNRVMLLLRNLESFRQSLGIEWFIRPDGSLGAKRVTVEEF